MRYYLQTNCLVRCLGTSSRTGSSPRTLPKTLLQKKTQSDTEPLLRSYFAICFSERDYICVSHANNHADQRPRPSGLRLRTGNGQSYRRLSREVRSWDVGQASATLNPMSRHSAGLRGCQDLCPGQKQGKVSPDHRLLPGGGQITDVTFLLEGVSS